MNDAPSLPLSQANVKIIDKWGCTEMKVHEFSYTWTIKNFSFCREGMGAAITSPAFYIGDNEEIEGSLILYPEGCGEGFGNYLSLYPKLVSCKEPKRNVIRARMECRIPTMNGIKSDLLDNSQMFTFTVEKEKYIHGFPKFLERKLLLANGNDLLLPDDELKILCRGSAAVKFLHYTGEFTSTPLTVPDGPVLEDLGSFLFENANFSDVTIVVNSREYSAHKVILAAQSSVFASMFNREMMEQQQNRVDITDIENDVFGEIIGFMYTGKAPNLKNMADLLLPAANKYKISKLKAMCEDELAWSIKTNNVADILILADQHSADKLKSQAIKFVARNAAKVKNTAGFKSMIRSHPQLLEKVLEHWN